MTLNYNTGGPDLDQAKPAQQEPAPGYCKHCKEYTIEAPLPAPAQQPLSEEQEREAFEKWMLRSHPKTSLSTGSDGQYWDDMTYYFWKAWQARAQKGTT